MSRDELDRREELLAEFTREVRQFNGLGASFFRAAASSIGMNVTDLHVIDILDITGPTTAGRLAELTGLTTGAITSMLDRLEKAGLVSRERDPNDGRKVVVKLTPSEDALREIGPIFESISQGWDQIAARYDDEQLTLLLEFLKRSNAMSREEFARLRETPTEGGGDFSAPLAEAGGSWLLVFSSASRLTLRGDAAMSDLYRAHFTGATPQVKVEEGSLTIRYPQRLWLLNWRQRTAEVALNSAVPWRIVIQGGASEITADLSAINLIGLDVKGGMSSVRLTLPDPAGMVPVLLTGGAANVTVRRPQGVPVRAHLKGWATMLTLDDQTLAYAGKDVWLQSPGYDAANRGYEIEVAGGASNVVITTD